MADITTIDFYTYPDGAAFDVGEHNENVYSFTEGRGIISEINGNLDRTNFRTGAHDDTLVQAEHIRRGETHRFAQEGARETIDYWDAAFGQIDYSESRKGWTDPSGATVNNSSFVPIAGCSVRIYLPYKCEMVLWQWSFFGNTARMFGVGEDGDYDKFEMPAPDIQHRAFLDGSFIDHSKRYFPKTIRYAIPDGPPLTTSLYSTEGRNCRHWDMHHLELNMDKGWHELSARIYMARNDNSLQLHTKTARTGRLATETPAVHDHYVHNRMTMGIRNARCMAMMKTATGEDTD